jgi:hypothetical protein
MATACLYREIGRNTGSPNGGRRAFQPDAREGQAGPYGVADRLVVPRKLGNASGGKGPDFGYVLDATQSQESGHVARTSPKDSAVAEGTIRVGEGQVPSWAVDRRVKPVGEPDAANPHVRFDEREVETEHGGGSEAPATERAGHRWATPKPPRHLSTLLIFS